MTRSRRPDVPLPFRGQRDPQGRKLCGYCGQLVGPRRVSWCSDECAQRYLIAKGDQNAARRWLWARDFGHCSLCRVDTVTPAEIAERTSYGRTINRAHWSPTGQWDADHTIPIAEGGALAPENLRTLCKPCHLRVTRELCARLAAAKRAAKSAAVGGAS